MAEFELYSDGGGNCDTAAAAAAIVRNLSDGHERRLVVFLGGATNNEAEITAALTGFSLIQALRSSEPVHVHWVADSEYTLKSARDYIKVWQRNGWKTAAKKPVKNQGLWRAYLRLSAGLSVQTEHVAGHSGHPENEACDRASTWARERGAEFLDAHGNGGILRSSDGGTWAVLDGRPFLQALRPDDADASGETMLQELITDLKLDSFVEGSSGSNAGGRGEDPAEKVLEQLALLRKKALQGGKQNPRLLELAEDLGAVLARYQR